jgi:hypothetical protein
MNTPAPTYDDLRPSATLEEAVERLGAAYKQHIQELETQRDALAACLREAHAGFVSGRFVCINAMDFATLAAFTLYMQRCWAALSAVPHKEAP